VKSSVASLEEEKILEDRFRPIEERGNASEKKGVFAIESNNNKLKAILELQPVL